ncbi:MAG: fumarylacetoacetate hydrolase family protein [Chloroflexota bacterium]
MALVEGDLVELGGTVGQLLAGGPDALRSAAEASTTRHPLDESRLLPAVPDPGKILCVGRNYADHAAELGNTPPSKHPEIFMRARTSLLGPFASVRRPRVSEQLDFEVELAVVIGRGGRYIRSAEAMDHVGGYAAFNDFSIRDYQNFGSQWIPGKNFDGSGPLGPYVVTPDEVGDPFDLDISLTIVTAGGQEERMQSSNTSLMVHRIPDVIAFCSEWTTLEPGDVIATGTPGGVGFGRRPYRWLEPGETVLTAVEGVGTLKNQVLEEGAATS